MPTMNPFLDVYMLLLDPRKAPKSRPKKSGIYSLRKNLRYFTQKSSQMVYQELTPQINRIMRE